MRMAQAGKQCTIHQFTLINFNEFCVIKKRVFHAFSSTKSLVKIDGHLHHNSIVILDAICVYHIDLFTFIPFHFFFATTLHSWEFYFLRSHKTFYNFDYCSELLTSIISTRNMCDGIFFLSTLFICDK